MMEPSVRSEKLINVLFMALMAALMAVVLVSLVGSVITA
jgi:hypothetical protein